MTKNVNLIGKISPDEWNGEHGECLRFLQGVNMMKGDSQSDRFTVHTAMCMKHQCYSTQLINNKSLAVCVCACVSFPLTTIILIKRVHAGKVDGEGLEGRRQADAALRSLHVETCRRAWVGRLGQARLGILHAEYGSRRLGWLSAAPHGRFTSLWKEELSENHALLTPNKIGAKTYWQQVATEVDVQDRFWCCCLSVRENASSTGAKSCLWSETFLCRWLTFVEVTSPSKWNLCLCSV